MSEPFLGELKLVSFAFAPKGWALCNGQTLPINQNQALFYMTINQMNCLAVKFNEWLLLEHW